MAEPLGVASVAVKADLDPLNADLAKARGQVDQFASTASQSMDKVGRSTSSAAKAQEGFTQSIAKSNVVYVDFTKNIQNQTDAVSDLKDQYKDTGTTSKNLADKIKDLATEGHSITEVLKIAGITAFALSGQFRNLALSAAGTGLRTAISGTFAAVPTALTVTSKAAGIAGNVFTSLLPILGPVALGFTALKIAAEAASTGIEKVTELSKLYDEATKSGVSAEFFNQNKKAAEELKIGADLLTGSLGKLFELMKPSTAGTELDKILKDMQEIDQITKAQTSSVSAASGDPKATLKAVADIVTDMLAKGERSAGLDLASKIWPPEVVSRLVRSNDYLQQITEALDRAGRADPIVSNQTVLYAKELQVRLDAAYKDLSVSFVDLTNLGLLIRGVWTSIIEVVAKVVTEVGNLFQNAIDGVANLAEAGTKAGKKAGATFQPVGLGVEGMVMPDVASGTVKGSRGPPTRSMNLSASEITGVEVTGDTIISKTGVADRIWGPETQTALKKLGQGLSSTLGADDNPNVVQQQGEMSRTLTKVWGDASTAAKDYKENVDKLDDLMPASIDKQKNMNKALDSASDAYKNAGNALKLQAANGIISQTELGQKLGTLKEKYDEVSKGIRDAAAENDAFNRAVQNVSRGIVQQEALGRSFNDGAAAIAKMRVEAQLTEVALSEKMDPTTGKVADTIKKLSDRAAEAAANLGFMKLKADAAFDMQQLGRTDTEAAVAAKLRPVVGAENVNAQMQSALGQQLIMIENLRVAKDITTNFATTFTSTFSQAIQNGAKGWDAFRQAGLAALNSLQASLLDMITKNLVAKAFGGIGGGGGGGLLGLLGMGGGGGSSAVTAGSYGGIPYPIFGQAQGGAWQSGIQLFAQGGVLNGPTIFKAANGLALAGEAGPEAIMPLTRGPGGKLGVAMPGGTGGGNSQTTNVYLTENYDFRGAENGVEQKVQAVMPKFQKQAVAAAVRAVQTGNRNTPQFLSK